jgi:hypothetical protein
MDSSTILNRNPMQLQRLGPVCSARLQAGTADSGECPPEEGRYISQKRAFRRAAALALLVMALAASASARELKIGKSSFSRIPRWT